MHKIKYENKQIIVLKVHKLMIHGKLTREIFSHLPISQNKALALEHYDL